MQAVAWGMPALEVHPAFDTTTILQTTCSAKNYHSKGPWNRNQPLSEL
jgi:hypothetical protein